MKNIKNQLTVFLISFYSDKKKIENIIKKIDKKIKILIIENSKLKKNQKYFQEKYRNVKVLIPRFNGGMTGGTNLAIKNIKTRFAIYMDIDVDFNKNIIFKFLHHAEKIKKFSMLGPNLYNSNYSNKFFLNKKRDDSKEYIKMSYMHFHFILFNMKAVKIIGPYDENIFFYFDEWDYCKRAQNTEYPVYLIRDLAVKHIGGKSYSKDVQLPVDFIRQWHYAWSKFYFNKKHFGKLNAFSIGIYDLFLDFSKLIVFFFFNNYKYNIYKNKISGLINSAIGRKSWKRLKI